MAVTAHSCHKTSANHFTCSVCSYWTKSTWKIHILSCRFGQKAFFFYIAMNSGDSDVAAASPSHRDSMLYQFNVVIYYTR